MKTWQLQEAKSKFSQLVDSAMKGSTQMVTKHGREAVVIMSVSEFESLKKSKNKQSLVDTLLSAPKVELDLSRSAEEIRELDL